MIAVKRISAPFIFLSCVLGLVCCVSSFGQQGEWTWMKGVPSAFASAGVWGTKGVSDPANEPPSVYEACEFSDKQGNLWIFGGVNNSTIIYYTTLWKYEIGTNEWTWVSGTNTSNQAGVYGTQGVPSPSNYPGSRGWGEVSWTDSAGNFWLFGGYGYDKNGALGTLADLWRYNVATNEWTWMKGPAIMNYNGSYGAIGVPNINNLPPSRQECACSWVDSHNNLWMFGGWSSIGNVNDLWKYDIATNTWTWMKGNNTANHYGIYGTKGVEAPLNNPGSRAAYGRWIDKDDNLWLYGGNGYSKNANGFLGDLWRYNMTSGNWTWMSGRDSIFQPPVYESKCNWSVDRFPGNKYENRACWVDDCGYFFLFGGTSYNGHEGDLWLYNNQSNEWTWVSGDTTTNTGPVSGTQGVSSPLNKPGLRTGANSWIDSSGNLWLFGGYVCSSDMWRFVPDYNCIGNVLCTQSSVINFSAADTQLCQKFCTDFFDQSTNNPTTWLWDFPGGTPASSTVQNPTNVCYNNPGTYDVTLITTGSFGSDTLFLPGYITVFATPAIPTITQNGNVLTCSNAASYQWQFNSVDIPGATNQSYTVVQQGFYTVVISDENGCVSSATIYVDFTAVENIADDSGIEIYPNPSNGSFIVKCLPAGPAGLDGPVVCEIDVVNALGQEIFSAKERISPGDFKKEISLQNISAGVYFLQIKSANIFLKKKIIISK